METMWKFSTARFEVIASIVPDSDADLSWADADDMAAIESGRHQVFGTIVKVFFDGREVGQNSLWGSVYADPREFFEAHRDSNAMNRNCSIMRAARGENVAICHYFPDMVREAIRDARRTIAEIGAANLRKGV